MATDQTLTTAAQLLEMPSEVRCELINGEVVEMSPVNHNHGEIAGVIVTHLNNYLFRNKVGKAGVGDVGYVIAKNPDTVRCPDVSFVRNSRLIEPRPTGFYPTYPDLAVEIISPRDRKRDVDLKTNMWLQAGTTCVWTVDPQRKTAAIHHLRDNHVVSGDVDALSCEDLLPGLAISVSDLF